MSSAPVTVNNEQVSKITHIARVLAPRPTIRIAVLRSGKMFKRGRSANEEAWLLQERGELRPDIDGCHHCMAGQGPFVGCVLFPRAVKNGFAQCANCHYNGTGIRCTIRQDDENRAALSQAANVNAVEPPNMGPAKNWGVSLKESGVFTAGPAPAPTPGAAFGAAPQVAVGGGGGGAGVGGAGPSALAGGGRVEKRRIAPTFVGTGASGAADSAVSRFSVLVAAARRMSAGERRARKRALRLELAALEEVDED